MMRQRLELSAGRGLARIGIVGHQIAPAQLQRIKADLRGREVDQAFGHRMAIGWPTARYWHITFLFWNTTRARAR